MKLKSNNSGGVQLRHNWICKKKRKESGVKDVARGDFKEKTSCAKINLPLLIQTLFSGLFGVSGVRWLIYFDVNRIILCNPLG